MARKTKVKEEVAEERITAPETPVEETRVDGEVEERLVNTAEAEEAPKDGDYLRQYQYRRQTEFGSPESDPAAGSKAAIMKEVLLAQPKVRVFVPREGKEDPSIKATVNLNGYRLDFPKQMYLEVPQQVAEVLMDSLEQTERALLQGQIAGDSRKETALL